MGGGGSHTGTELTAYKDCIKLHAEGGLCDTNSGQEY